MSEKTTFDKLYNPDVLSCLANLSNDEVFTPPDVANAMLDMLPQELFKDPDATFLDPACKSGVFLREIAKRLIEGLADEIPDLQERIDHIFHKQLYGIAITELTSLLSRRSVYCSKYPNGNYSVSKFENAEGNIRYKRVHHTWKDSKCIYCGVKHWKYERAEDLENYAYEWIHEKNPEEIFKMRFDVIISNPPYQLSDGGGGAGKSATSIYNKFVEQAKLLKPRYMTMIIPSRWFSGGKMLQGFRKDMLNDRQISKIVDYADSKDCFSEGVDIPGGICYFLWEYKRDGECEIINVLRNGKRISQTRALNEFDILVRDNKSLSIVKKIASCSEKHLDEQVSSRKPFGLESNTKFDENGTILLRSNAGLGKIQKNRIVLGKWYLPKWKVIVSKVSYEHAGVPGKDGKMKVLSVVQVLPPDSACTESYLVAGVYDTQREASNFAEYLKTKFVRFLITPMLASMNMSKGSYRFVPIQDFSVLWTDSMLYQKYGLTKSEIDLIESRILPME